MTDYTPTDIDEIMEMDDAGDLADPYNSPQWRRQRLEDEVEQDEVDAEAEEQHQRALLRALWIGAAQDLARLLADHPGACAALRVAAETVAQDGGADRWSTGYAEGMCRVLEAALDAADRRGRVAL